ncbi:hypothetical protein F5Y10DRAFT_258138 [Nemania abortiva]|nr:hypothetical protein F5Y10DRAFT_258138 [Nemania abortiva]
MLQKYDLNTVIPSHVKNGEFIHWKRSFLARCWEHHAASSTITGSHRISLAYLLLVITSPSIFSPPHPTLRR